MSGPSRTCVFDRVLSYRVSDYTKKSRFVLYENGARVLQYRSIGDAIRRTARTTPSIPSDEEGTGW